MNGYKTYIVAVIAILSGLVTIVSSDDFAAGWTQILGGLGGLAARHSIQKLEKPSDAKQ